MDGEEWTRNFEDMNHLRTPQPPKEGRQHVQKRGGVEIW